ncbi:hypothetical protein J2Y40_001129 [Chryseobacterium sp. 2987]|nr:hypothetical protein [Chryseobacterium sp. 2987]
MMKRRLFRYRGVTATVTVFNFLILLLFGFGTFDTYNLFINEKDDASSIAYFVLFLGGFILLLACATIVMVLIKYSKSVMFLNIYYGFLIVILSISLIFQKFGDVYKSVSSSDHLILRNYWQFYISNYINQ